ncbi:ubiquitin-activating_enzyme-like_protein (plasmid) [Leishmania braziliensis MHOM/BR/75/M2904]|uniref:Ubiquitin-activating_enzyme-like_protein n=1 Tax=Leishmania braziliensis MHOM/BR/75/M2904 TaxID=420245 RepID=A0A3P3YYS2_LEIBR|nr:unnamed protein product [Leishmania braziliensis]CAJ2467674.1 unnamed protein product [Leishmania braziliensis]SYZ63107.1 ubiquitin-activating_enzyme-like_protein [Leishmania braziliensis MHOM/BR/75/M2904]
MIGDGSSGVAVDVQIGHVVIPCASAATAAPSAVALPLAEPAHKRARVDTVTTLSNPSTQTNVVIAAAWSEEHIAEALRRYAVASLTVTSGEVAEGGSPLPSSTATAAAAVLKTVNESASSWVAAWPAVRLSPTRANVADGDSEATKSTSAGWSAVSFSFVPGVLVPSPLATTKEGHASVSEVTVPDAAPAVDATTLRVLAAISLPRALCVPYRGTAMEAVADSCSGCVSAVLTERIQIRASTATPASRLASFPCMDSVLPAELLARPIFLVGAGGIGCEVLKVLVLRGFTQIHLIDLDTIDATNLNRQFLFQVSDVGQSKAITARRVVLDWFAATNVPSPDHTGALRGRRTPPCIVAYHDSVKADRYDDAFYRQFAVVLGALDNVSARQHVNRMCMRNNVPLIESGTMGYNGQVQPMLKDVYECYDCRPKPPDTKTFAVCTIHARPTTMVHCVHYAKELYETLFGSSPSDTDGKEAGALASTRTTAATDTASAKSSQEVKEQQRAAAPSDGGELSYLRTMVSDWRCRVATVPSGLTGASMLGHSDGGDVDSGSASSAAALAVKLLRLLFVANIEALLSLKSFWPGKSPEPLSRHDIDCVAAAYMTPSATVQPSPPPPPSGDHVLSVQACMELFLSSVVQCLARPSGLAFRKEDDAAVRFVSATANMRAHVFHIAKKSLEDVRSIAGSIVPAIATTNAIIAGAVVHELISLLRSSFLPESMTATHPPQLSPTKVTGGSASASTQASPGAHVVYARKAPQLRRRRVPHPLGQQRIAPALFMEYAGGDAPSTNDGTSTSVAHYAPPQVALTLVGTEQSSAHIRLSDGAAEGGGRKGRSEAVMDHYLVHSTVPNPPNRLHCLVCQDVQPEVRVSLNLRTATLGQFVHLVLEDALGLVAPSVSYGPTMLYEDEDYEALAEHMLADVLQLSPAEAEWVTHQHQCYTLTADSPNKNVPWSVVLTHGVKGEAAAAPSSSTMVFEVSGLEQAEAAEQRALARLAAQQVQEESSCAKNAEESHGGPSGATGLTSSAVVTTAPAVVSVLVLDDDEVQDVTPASSGVSNLATGESVTVLD